MAKDNKEAAKLELIAQLLASQETQTEEPKKKKQSKRSGKSVGEVVSKSSKTKAQREKAGQAELRKAMKKARSEELKPKK